MDVLKGYEEDAMPGNDDDPEYQTEMFELFRMRNWKPEDLMDQTYALKYAEWLKIAPPKQE